MTSTKRQAGQVFQKHGSRKSINDFRKENRTSKKAKPAQEREQAGERNRKSIRDMLRDQGGGSSGGEALQMEGSRTERESFKCRSINWQCTACTFENSKSHAPVCEMCGTTRS